MFPCLSLEIHGLSGTVGMRLAVPNYLGLGAVWETTQIPEDPLTQDLQDQGTGIASLGDSFAVSEFPMLRDLQGKTYINFIQQPKLM